MIKIIFKIKELSKKTFNISLLMQITIVLLFLLTLALIVLINEKNSLYLLTRRITFIDLTNEFIFRIHKSQQLEEDYLLYGKKSEDITENISVARDIIYDNYDRFKRHAGEKQVKLILNNLTKYIDLFEKLYKIRETKKDISLNDPEIIATTTEIRDIGVSISNYSRTLMGIERDSLHENMDKFIGYNLFYLSVPFITLFVMGLFLLQKVLIPVRKLLEHSKNVSIGSYTPIELHQRFRDEFDTFAKAFNDMVKTLENRQQQTIQTHKLRAIGTLTAGVAHELNNPLNNIIITSNTLIDEFNDYNTDEIKEMITDIVNDSERARKIVRDLLDFSRESSSSMKSIIIKELIDETMHLVNNELSLKQISTDIHVERNLPPIYGDDQKLKQVFINLILNAKDAMSEKGHILISASLSRKSNSVHIKITDDGTGIPKHILDHIFDPFFTTKNLSSGTGLGLSVCQGIIANHNGQLSVDSLVGVGTTFTVSLPVTTIRSDNITM
jgi:signal transduction histidine kinase